MRVNGFGSLNIEEGTYVIFGLTFASEDSNSRYIWLRVFVILNFQERSSGITEKADSQGEPLIDIDKPWTEYYLSNY